MENSYESGFAFVLEGATERVFYERLLYFFARKHPNCSKRIKTQKHLRRFSLCVDHSVFELSK